MKPTPNSGALARTLGVGKSGRYLFFAAFFFPPFAFFAI